MKTIKYLLIAVLFMAAYSASAQFSTSAGKTTTLDDVGIGTATPNYLLHVSKNMIETGIIVQNSGGIGGATFRMIDDVSAADWKFKATNLGGFKIRDQASALDVFTVEKNAMANAIYIKAGGFVGIGTTSPTSALTVNGDVTANNISALNISSNGKITTKEVEVTLTGWPDYVFDEEYKLTPLNEVEKFIYENGHLPNVPTEKQIIDNGLQLGEMNKILMEKVEELTLYVIQLQKEINNLK